MKRTIMGGLLAVGTLLGGLALTGTANAIAVADNDQPETEVCYAPVEYTVYQFSKTTSTPTFTTAYRWDIETRTEKFKDIIEKETRTRTWAEGTDAIPSKWWVWSPNNSQGPQDYTPDFPSDARGTWQGPKTEGGPDQNTYGTFNASNGNSGNSSWFHRSEPVPGTEGAWSEWGPWTDWPGAGPLIDDGRARGPLPHGSGNGWERQYRYVVVDQSPDGYTAWVGAGSTEWGPSATPPADTPTTRYVNKQTDAQVPGEPIVTVVYYNDGNVGPKNLAEKGVRANWTTDQTLDRSWKQIGTDTFKKNGDRVPCDEQPGDYTTTREVAEPCTVVGQTTTKVTVYTQDWTYELNDDSEWVPVKFGDEYVKTTYVRDLTTAEKDSCPTPPPTPTPTPTPEQPGQAQLPPPPPPVAAAPAVVAPAVVAPAVVAPAAVAPAAPAPTQLPSTGSSSWVMALIALAFLVGGTGLMRLSRRSTN